MSILFLLIQSAEVAGGSPLCCPEDPELSYLLSPTSSQQFRYLVRYETFFSTALGREKGFFVILPEDFYRHQTAKYALLFLLHGYNFHRRGFWWKVQSPEKAREIACQKKEEEYHWLIHEDIAIVASALTDPQQRTYGDLERSLGARFRELSTYGGLGKGDDQPEEIARSIVFHNLHPGGKRTDPFRPLQKMILVLPDGDNGFYTDENEGKALFPETKNRRNCDADGPGEAMNYSLLPFLLMRPAALGRYESYFLELVRYVESHSLYQTRVLPKRGLGGFSMGGFGAMKLGLKYPHLFHSVSSQSGLLDIGLLKDKWILKMIFPEFLEVFGRLEPKRLPTGSSLDLNHVESNNPLALIKKRGITRLPDWFYFDYGKKEGFNGILQGNKNVEIALMEPSHEVPVQPFNGKASHNYQFWRSRSGNILKHHSDLFQKMSSNR